MNKETLEAAKELDKRLRLLNERLEELGGIRNSFDELTILNSYYEGKIIHRIDLLKLESDEREELSGIILDDIESYLRRKINEVEQQIKNL
jgi:hypothetical protein